LQLELTPWNVLPIVQTVFASLYFVGSVDISVCAQFVNGFQTHSSAHLRFCTAPDMYDAWTQK